ncbi:acyl-CoA thioesterase [Nocardia uniformis]|uniref:acyl-CoA thioesterase n=1 Tax=Nocardia uniformis TaxID=53432 RepID=UPI00082DAA94|nr:acyl-CoA thioesterase [Nocardia uniformis]
MNGVTIQRLIDWQDTDAAGHYHHSTVIRWVEAAEAALLDRVDLARLFGHIPRVRYEVDYLDRLWFGDTASIELSIGKIGRSSIRYDFVVSRIPARAAMPASDSWTIAARGALIATYAPGTENGSRPWPDHIAAALRGAFGPAPDTGDQPIHLRPTPIREV